MKILLKHWLLPRQTAIKFIDYARREAEILSGNISGAQGASDTQNADIQDKSAETVAQNVSAQENGQSQNAAGKINDLRGTNGQPSSSVQAKTSTVNTNGVYKGPER